MGAFSRVLAFDHDRHERVVVPALRAFLDSGKLSAELGPIFDRQYQARLAAEAKYADFYAKHPKGSLVLEALKAGLRIDLSTVCNCLDQDLGARHTTAAELAAIQPGPKGGCHSDSCIAPRACPFHVLPPEVSDSEDTMSIFQQMVMTSSVEPPAALVLGRHFGFDRLCDWYGNEIGREDAAARQFFLSAHDALPLLLARLCKRGGIWGWRDGGYGEGLLGWLSWQEGLKLAKLLDAYDLLAEAAVPASLSDEYVREQVLPAMRLTLADLRDYARNCASQQLGILLERV
ncbi:MAG: hypothetical protein ACAI44_20245 [Candidatus Sericytochromatia bacterium]